MFPGRFPEVDGERRCDALQLFDRLLGGSAEQPGDLIRRVPGAFGARLLQGGLDFVVRGVDDESEDCEKEAADQCRQAPAQRVPPQRIFRANRGTHFN
jgi:hypothetical protein